MNLSTIKRHYRHRAGRWGYALALAAVLCLLAISPAAAQDDLTGNFQFSYDPVSFDKNEVCGGEVFRVAITGRVTCIKDLPISAGEASLTSRVVAVPADGGTELTLNSSYTVTIKPFPSKKGQSAEISQSIPLQFPAAAASGSYDVVGRTVEARVKVLLAWVDVSSYLPQSQSLGTIKYTAPEATGSPSPSSNQPAPGRAAAPTVSPAPSPPPEPLMPWWAELLVIAIPGSAIFAVVRSRRQRTR